MTLDEFFEALAEHTQRNDPRFKLFHDNQEVRDVHGRCPICSLSHHLHGTGVKEDFEAVLGPLGMDYYDASQVVGAADWGTGINGDPEPLRERLLRACGITEAS